MFQWFKRVLPVVTALALMTAPAFAASVLHRGNGAEPDTLDPNLAQGTWENHIIGDMIIGLYTEDVNGEPIYGAAVSHTVSDDGLVWTFKLRDMTWSDGAPVTADDFIYSWQRILNPQTAAQYASLIATEIKGGLDILEGRAGPEALGARAIAAKTLEITLTHPAPYLPQLLAHQTTFPIPKHVVEQFGRDWVKAGNYVTNGAYVLAEWVPNDYVHLVKNPLFYDADNVKIDEVYYYPTSDTSAALKRFRAGELDMQDGLTSQDIAWLKENMPGSLFLKPYLAVSYISMNTIRPPYTDVRVREALNLAFDRDTIATKVLQFEEPAAYGLTPPGTAGTNGAVMAFKDMPYEARVARAQELMREAGFGPDNRLKARFEIGPSPDNKRVGAAVQQMWKAIYVDIELQASESKVLYDLLREGDFDLAQAAWVGDYNDAKNFLFLYRTDSKDMNYGKWSNATFDQLMFDADQTADGTARAAILSRAEQIMLDDYAFIPNRFLNVRHVVQPWVKGYVTNMRDVNRTRWMSIDRPATGPEAAPSSAGGQPGGETALAEQSFWDWLMALICSWTGLFCSASS